jgi:hypothetical protein
VAGVTLAVCQKEAAVTERNVELEKALHRAAQEIIEADNAESNFSDPDGDVIGASQRKITEAAKKYNVSYDRVRSEVTDIAQQYADAVKVDDELRYGEKYL